MKRIDKVLKELSSLYELNRKIEKYTFKNNKSQGAVRSAGSEYKLRKSSDK